MISRLRSILESLSYLLSLPIVRHRRGGGGDPWEGIKPAFYALEYSSEVWQRPPLERHKKFDASERVSVSRHG